MSVNPVVEYERSRCAILTLILKRKWFDMIASGEKREEYRAATRYWRVRLHNWCRRAPTSLPVVEFRLGYSATAQRMAYWCLGIETASGLMPYAYVDSSADKRLHPEWGESSGPHFVISLGDRVKLIEDMKGGAK